MPTILFIIGCCFGSFINVVLSRKDWYKGRSRCDTCGYILKWYDLIPIISFACKGKMSQVSYKIGACTLQVSFIWAVDLRQLASTSAWHDGGNYSNSCHHILSYAISDKELTVSTYICIVD